MNTLLPHLLLLLLVLLQTQSSSSTLLYDKEHGENSTVNSTVMPDKEVQLLDSVLKSLSQIPTDGSADGTMELKDIIASFMAKLMAADPDYVDLSTVNTTSSTGATRPNETIFDQPRVIMHFTRKLMQQLLDTHNHMRMAIAKGKVTGQPPATDMMLVEWDDRLAQRAAEWSKQCIGQHDDPENRTIPGYSWIGQNLVGAWRFDIRYLTNYWFKESSFYDFQYKECKPGEKCGHYTQLGWARSLSIGCWLHDCHNKLPYSALLVCNYAPGGNFDGRAPYHPGPACSGCHHEYRCCMEGLCSTVQQCKNASVECNCTVSQGMCKNNSTFDAANCRCICPQNFFGVLCENECRDNIEYCKQMVATGSTKSEFCRSQFGGECKKFCQICHEAALRDPGIENKNAILARVIL